MITRAGYRLGITCARRFGVVFAASAMLNLIVPAFTMVASVTPVLIGLALFIGSFFLLGRRGGLVWVALSYGVGLAALAAFLLPGSGVVDGSTLASVTALSSTAIPSLLVAIAERPWMRVAGVIAAVPVLALAVAATVPFGRAPFVAIAIVGGWLAIGFAGTWLARSARRADAGVERLRQGYAAERRSTEAEAELRYGARVLHDTVLATLSVIAHAGAGVAPAVLRAQAAADSELLGRLRTAGTIGTRAASGTLAPESSRSAGIRERIDASPAGSGSGSPLSVTWHGADQVDASPETLDALVRALSECLENVRRHSGELRAEVTISQDDRVVRAVVTDTGIGFDRDRVPRGRLGLAESVEARIRATGGSTRIFSSPGRGTTVLLEVPR